MLFAFLGKDISTKEQKIAELKAKYLPSSDMNHFDLEILYADKLEAELLKKSLVTIPVLAKHRFIIIHTAHKLKDQHCQIIKECHKANANELICILDSDESDLPAIPAKLLTEAKVFKSQIAVPQSVFDMTNSLSARNPTQALKILNELFAEGHHPLQVMGALIWFWGKMKARLSVKAYKKGLLLLQEADLSIKRSRLDPEYAMEVLLVKLSSLLG